MKATGSVIPERDFVYGRYRYVTWDAHSTTDEEGNNMVEFNYAEAAADCSDAEMRAAVMAELEKTGESARIDEIMAVAGNNNG